MKSLSTSTLHVFHVLLCLLLAAALVACGGDSGNQDPNPTPANDSNNDNPPANGTTTNGGGPSPAVGPGQNDPPVGPGPDGQPPIVEGDRQGEIMARITELDGSITELEMKQHRSSEEAQRLLDLQNQREDLMRELNEILGVRD